MSLRREILVAKVGLVSAALASSSFGVLSLLFAPDDTSRYIVTAVSFSVAIAGFVSAMSVWLSYWFVKHTMRRSEYAVKRSERIINRAETSMQLVIGHVETLLKNPTTAATGQRAMDDLRNIWGDKIDDWTGNSGLN